MCDNDLEDDEMGALTIKDTCAYETYIKGPGACPVYSTDAIFVFLQQYSWLWGIMMIVVGLFFAFFGRKLFLAALFTGTTIVVAGLILIIFYSTFLSSNTKTWVGWVVLLCSVVAGLICGFLMLKASRLGAAILAGWGGFMVGIALNQTVLYTTHSKATFWTVNCILAVVGAIAGFLLFNHAIILSTSFGGSYLFIRGISMYAGGFPNEFELAKQIDSGVTPNVGGWFYLYLGFILAFTVFGSIIQYKMFKNLDEEDKHPYDRLRA